MLSGDASVQNNLEDVQNEDQKHPEKIKEIQPDSTSDNVIEASLLPDSVSAQDNIDVQNENTIENFKTSENQPEIISKPEVNVDEAVEDSLKPEETIINDPSISDNSAQQSIFENLQTEGQITISETTAIEPENLSKSEDLSIGHSLFSNDPFEKNTIEAVQIETQREISETAETKDENAVKSADVSNKNPFISDDAIIETDVQNDKVEAPIENLKTPETEAEIFSKSEFPISAINDNSNENDQVEEQIKISETPGSDSLKEVIHYSQPTLGAEGQSLAAGTGGPKKRGRKSFKEMDAEIGLVDLPEDDVLFKKQYYPISQVAGWFGVNTSLLRFWDNEFDILKPRKNKKGDRLFRPEDIKNLQVIYYLLRQRKFTIEGARKYLKENSKTAETHVQIIQSLNKFKGFLLELKANLGR